MNKKNLMLVIILVLLLSLGAAPWAMAIPTGGSAITKAALNAKSPVIQINWDIVRVDYIHYAKASASGRTKTDPGYKLMGVQWKKFPVSYSLNTANLADEGLNVTTVKTVLNTSCETWDTAAGGPQLYENSILQVKETQAAYGVYDLQNTIAFGVYSGNSSVIAVTSVWYNRRTKEIVEFDMLFNTSFVWGDATKNSSVMDLENIATHELGHAFGLSDIYSTTFADVTMYGYASEGETNKSTLEQPDIAGIRTIYGQP